MKIVWDEPKRLANIAKHGLDFADIKEEFFIGAVIDAAKNGRFVAIGRLANGAVTVIFATLGAEGVSIISMRSANRKERKRIDG
ncbi:BrnT family toxin [Bradyrhizobium sp. dw_78]|uniref:BrnT family toxin n=1 Tax=Bradyrhizobium sp. dw_78 TaxID=2719793 RepID=UPI001BD52B1F|nr:BrnT family toxin [Bradyrhizobium sp. dw_78]